MGVDMGCVPKIARVCGQMTAALALRFQASVYLR